MAVKSYANVQKSDSKLSTLLSPSPGSLSLNRALARRRSAAFYQMAQDVGVPVLRLIEAASPPHFGETTPVAEEANIQGRAFNRRTELFITRDTSAS